jgi:hypothetical protein
MEYHSPIIYRTTRYIPSFSALANSWIGIIEKVWCIAKIQSTADIPTRGAINSLC